MTNGGDRHHGKSEKKKKDEKSKPRDPAEALKRKNMLPKALAAQAKR
jgi:hypothetical protein